MSKFTEMFSGIVLIIGIILGIMAGNIASKVQCENWKSNGFNTKLLTTGALRIGTTCYIQQENGKWIPAGQYRAIGD